MTWNDHDHRGEYAEEQHDHDLDCAEKHHRHYDVEHGVESARHGVDELRATVRELREQLDDALGRIAALEKQTPEARQLQLEADLAAADLAESGYDRHGRDCQCPFCYYDPEDETELTPDAMITQAEIAADDAARRIVAEPSQPTHDLSGEPALGPAAMCRFIREHPLGAPRQASRVYWPDALCEFVDREMCGAPAVARVTSRAIPSEHLWCCGPHRDHMLQVSPEDAYVSWAKPGEGPCAETSDGMHCGHWYDGGRCCACGLYGPEPDNDSEPEEYDPGPEADDEGGMSEYRYTLLPEDYERGQ